MSLTKLTENLNNVSSLPDKPTQTSDELKAVFDKAGNIIKGYINDVLTTEIEKLITTKINESRAIVNGTISDINNQLKEVNEKIDEVVLYENKEGSIESITLNDTQLLITAV